MRLRGALVAALTAACVQSVCAQAPKADQSGASTVAVIRTGSGTFASYLSKSSTDKPAAPSEEKVVEPVFALSRGALVHEELQRWAKSAGWELVWYPDVSWRVLGATSFDQHKDVTEAIGEVIQILREERRAVRLEVAEGNRIMEVISTELVSNKGISDE